MTRKTLDHLGYPRSTAEEAEEIRHAAERRRVQMLPGNGPREPVQEAPVSHFKGEESPVILGPAPDPLPVIAETLLDDGEPEQS